MLVHRADPYNAEPARAALPIRLDVPDTAREVDLVARAWTDLGEKAHACFA